MKAIIVTILLLMPFSYMYAKDKPEFIGNRLSFSAGTGMSYSIYNNRLSKQEVIPSLREQKKSVGFNFFGELNIQMKHNFYMSIGLDYNQFNSRKLSAEDGLNSEDVRLNYLGKISDRYTSIQITANKKINFKKHSVHLGTGLLFSFIKNPAISIWGGEGGVPYQMEVSERKTTEIGIPFQLKYEYAINPTWNIGLKSQFQYLVSVQSAEHIYFSPFVRVNLGQ